MKQEQRLGNLVLKRVDLRWLYTISSVFAGSDIYISRLSGSFSPVKISGFKHSFEYVSSCALLKTPFQLINLVSMATSRRYLS